MISADTNFLIGAIFLIAAFHAERRAGKTGYMEALLLVAFGVSANWWSAS